MNLQKVLGDETARQICEILAQKRGEFVSEIAIAIELKQPLFLLRKKFQLLQKAHLIKNEQYSWQALPNLICAVGSEQDSHLQGQNSTSICSASPKQTQSAEISSPSDTQTVTTTATCESLSQPQREPSVITLQSREELMLLQPAHRASPSQSRAKGLEQTTSGTVSRPSSKPSGRYSRSSSPSRTCPESSPAPTDQEADGLISDTFYHASTRAGTMRSGLLSGQDTLERPFLESGYFWLESPSALSHSGKGRPPGSTKLETQLKSLELLKKGECLNPDWLEKHYRLPVGWTSPLESRTATELLAEGEKLWAMPLIQELQESPSSESFTCPSCSQPLLSAKDGCGVCAWSYPLEPKRKQASGTIYPYTKTKKLKCGASATYPKVAGARDPDNPRHWLWHYCYEERSKNGWRCRKVHVPVPKVAAVRSLIDSNSPVEKTLQFIEGRNVKCPDCSSTNTYRKSKTTLEVHCDDCGHKWKAKQPAYPLLEGKTHRKTAPKGKHIVTVWYCPIDVTKYSFGINYRGGVAAFNEFKGNPYVSGCYNSPEEALEAGIKEVQNDG